MSTVKELLGQQFGRLTVLERAENRGGRVAWQCSCSCGKTVVVRSRNLVEGMVRSCGCLRAETTARIGKSIALPLGEAAFNDLFSKYQKDARRRGYSFELLKEEARLLFEGVCVYCGVPPSQTRSQATFNGDFVYNGIDRLDNSKGYTLENAVSCCWKCNSAKGSFGLQEALKLVELAKERGLI